MLKEKWGIKITLIMFGYFLIIYYTDEQMSNGAIAQWPEHAIADRVVPRSNRGCASFVSFCTRVHMNFLRK